MYVPTPRHGGVHIKLAVTLTDLCLYFSHGIGVVDMDISLHYAVQHSNLKRTINNCCSLYYVLLFSHTLNVYRGVIYMYGAAGIFASCLL